MLKIKFRYRDSYNYPEWSEQSCVMDNVDACIKFYGLGVDCEYEIISIEEVQI